MGVWAAIFLTAWLVGGAHRAARGRPIDHGATYRFRERLLRLARPTLLLIPAKSPGFSKVGGSPDLPRSVGWPIGIEGPLAFVAQLDLAAFQPHGGFDWLPKRGHLYLFFDDARNGCADSGRVLFTEEAPSVEASEPPALPKSRRFTARHVGFMQFRSYPSWEWLDEDWPDANLDLEDPLLAREADFGDEIEHRIGGFPSEIQGGQMALECEYLHRGLIRDYQALVPNGLRRASWQWRLLLQIDSDPALNMNWWDGGRIYVFVRARDAKRGDFSKTVTLTQTH
jgi:uncharacterized protein YwqG